MTNKLILVASSLGILAAQDVPVPAQAGVQVFERRVAGPEAGAIMMQPTFSAAPAHQMAIQFMGVEGGIAGTVVKGAPYAAQAVTENTQALADGNRIRNKTTSQLYRDSEGRTRRESSLGGLGMGPEADLPPLVFISDPVAGASYVLDTRERTAQKSKMSSPDQRVAELKQKLEAEAKARTGGGNTAFIEMRSAHGESGTVTSVQNFTYRTTASGPGHKAPNARTESLGKQTIEGLVAEGSRTTISIAAGEIGNDRPIEIVDERWYSPELQVTVMTRHVDPRMGENVYRLTNISRSEPSATLFEPPADFKVTENKGGDFIRMRIPAKPQED